MTPETKLGKLSALDTETIGGYAVILATEHRSWEAHTFEECVLPIFNDIHKGRISGRLMLYNQGYDSQAIIKYLPDDNVWEIINTNETVYNERYHITFIRGKVLRIRDLKMKETISGYDIAQFFNYMHLDDAGEKYVNDNKINNEITHEITERARYHDDNQLYWIFAQYKKEIMEYCQQDARLTQKLGYYLAKTIKALFGFYIRTYSAKTVLGKEMIKRTVGTYTSKSGKKVMAYPKFLIDSSPAKAAHFSYHGGIFDCKKRGTFGECTDIDISSAYPYHMKTLPNWSNGDFIEVDSSEIQKTDYYGWVWCRFDYPMIPYTSEENHTWEEVHDGEPTTVTATNFRKYYPTGERWQCITLIEARFLKKYGYLLDCIGGFVWRHNPKKPQYPDPFSWIDQIYDLKRHVKVTEGKDSYKYSLTKIPMNSAYGTTAQKKGFAVYRNMFYASYITASTRVQICEMLEEIGYDAYITIATDGILLEGFYNLPERYTTGGLGSWDVEHWDKAVVIGNGVYQLSRGDKQKIATRGMLSFNGDLIELITKHKDEPEFTPSTKQRPVTMYQSMRWKKYTKDDMNRFKDISRTLRCDSDTTKKWDEIPTFNSLLHEKFVGKRFTIDEIDPD